MQTKLFICLMNLIKTLIVNPSIAVLLFAFISCNSFTDKIKPESQQSFFANLLKTQEEKLNMAKNAVSKISNFNGITDTSTIRHINWSKELAIFYPLDIFKPIYKGAYSNVISIKDGAQLSKYMKIAKSKSNMDSLIINKNVSGKLQQIAGISTNQNFFFNAKSSYCLMFDTVSGNLKSYDLYAEKTFIWGKHNAFSISSTILY